MSVCLQLELAVASVEFTNVSKPAVVAVHMSLLRPLRPLADRVVRLPSCSSQLASVARLKLSLVHRVLLGLQSCLPGHGAAAAAAIRRTARAAARRPDSSLPAVLAGHGAVRKEDGRDSLWGDDSAGVRGSSLGSCPYRRPRAPFVPGRHACQI